MEPTFVTREAFHVLGVHARVRPESADYHHIWKNRFEPHRDHIESVAARQGYYNVYFACKAPGWADLVAGMEVAADEAAPTGAVLREVPAADYAVFKCPLSAIGTTWAFVYETWLPGSDEFAEDGAKACFEYFPPDFDTGKVPLLTHVPLKPK